MIKLSIITPYHNEPENRIERMLESLSSQRDVDFNSIEIIVINNCDEPRKPKVISKHIFSNLNVRYLLSKTKNYIGASRQTGIDNCKGEYFTFIDSDDTLYDTAVLRDMLQVVNDHPNYDIYCFDEIQEYIKEGEHVWSRVGENDVTPHAKIFRTEFIKSNRIRHLADIRYSEDTLFNLNCALNKPSIVTADRIVYKNHYNKDSTTHSDFIGFCKKCTIDHCLGVERLAKKYKSQSTAVFNLLIKNLKSFKLRIGRHIDIDIPLLLTAVHIYNIIENINDDEVEDKITLNAIKTM